MTPAQKKLLKDLDEKIENTKIGDDEEESVDMSEAMPYFKMLLTYADGSDKCYLAIGWSLAMLTGAGLPAFSVLFGDLVDGTG